MDSEDPPRVKQWKEWIAANVNNGLLTQRDLEWISSEPSPLIDFFPLIGAVLGLTAAGLASRIRLSSTLRPWSFTRTVSIAAGATGAGLLAGDALYDRSLYRFERNSDSPVLAQIAKLKHEHAVVRDAAERARGQIIGSNDKHTESLNDAMRALDVTFRNAVESVILSSLIPEDVQVFDASGNEIRGAIESIIQEEVIDDGIDVSENDLEILVDCETHHWKNKPIESPLNPIYPASFCAGAIGVYGRIMQKPPLRWRWLPITFVSVYAATYLYSLGFGTFRGSKPADDWLELQFIGMEVRASIAEKIASNRLRSFVQSALDSGDSDSDLLVRSAYIIRSASNNTDILFSYPLDASNTLSERSGPSETVH